MFLEVHIRVDKSSLVSQAMGVGQAGVTTYDRTSGDLHGQIR